MKKRIITLILVFVLAITTTVTVFADTVGDVVTEVQTDETYTIEEDVTEEITAEVPAEAADEETAAAVDEEITVEVPAEAADETIADEETNAAEETTADEETTAVDEETAAAEETTTAEETTAEDEFSAQNVLTSCVKMLVGIIEETVDVFIWCLNKDGVVTLSGTYYFNEDTELPPIEVGDGGLTMIIKDGVTVTIDARKYDDQGRYAGIVSEDPDNPLVIASGRDEDDPNPVEGTGKLIVYGGCQSAAIGGRAVNKGGYVTIEGCTVYAYGGDGDSNDKGSGGAGIGGGAGRKGEDITINGGTVYAYGGNNAAGIGSGGECYADAEDIEINGGTVYAYGDQEHSGGAGIGGGAEGGCEDITINGGTVYAYGTGTSAGIGSGTHFTGDLQGHDITITGGTVRAYGASKDEDKGGAGIGSAYGHKAYNIKVTGGDVEAYGYGGAAGIGGGGGVNGSTYATHDIEITGGTVKAVSVKESGSSGKGAGIGSGAYSNAKEISISGGTITAISEYEGAGIGSGSQGNLNEGEYGIKITGGNITAESKDGGAGIGAGYKGDAKAIEISGDDTVINATANNGAGIGGGSHANAKNITIEGGTIVATSRGKGAGIGSGWGGQTAKKINITGGHIEAYGGGSGNTWGEGCGCGIGVGYFDSNKTEPNDEITIKTSLEAQYLKNGQWYDLANNGDDLAHYGDANFMKWRVVKIDNAKDKSIVIGSQKNIQEYGTADKAEYDLTTAYISGDAWTAQWYKDDKALDKFDAEVKAEDGIVFVYYNGTENAGVYSFTLSCDGVTSNKAVFTIAKRSASITSGSAKKVYDGTPLTCETYETSGFADGEGVAVTCTGSQTAVGTSKNTFTVSAKSGTNLDNYSIEENEGTLEVVEQPFVVTGENYSGIYDGKDHEFSVKVTGKNGVDYTKYSDVTIEYSTDGGSWSETVPSIKNAGTIKVKARATYAGKTDQPICSEQYTMTVTARNVTLSSASKEKEYDGKPLTANTADDVGVSGDGFAEGEAEDFEFIFDEYSTITKAGSQENKFECKKKQGGAALEANYKINYVYGQLVVTPKSELITITTPDASKLYDGSYIDAGTAASNFDAVKAAGDSLTVKLYHNHVLGAASNDFDGRVKDAGTYNNDIESYVVTNASGDDVTGCYSFAAPETGTLTIEKRKVTLTSGTDMKVKTQDGDFAYSDVVTESGNGLLNNEKLAYSGFQKVTEVSYEPTDNTFEYAAASGSAFKADNYDITVETGYLMLVEEMSIVGKDATFTYDGTKHEVPVQLVDNGKGAEVEITYSTSTDNNSWSAYTKTVPSLKDAGTLYVKAKATKGVQTKEAEYKITVNRRSVTLKSESASKQYDGEALTCSICGIYDEGFAADEGLSVFKCTGTQTDLGESKNTIEYTLKSNTNEKNYNIAVLCGTLEVTKNTKPIAIKTYGDSWVYNGMALMNSEYTVTWGDAFVENGKLFGSDVLKVVNTGSITDVGSAENECEYQVIRNGSVDVTEYYTFKDPDYGTLTVTPRSIIINVSSAEKVYDGQPLTCNKYTELGDGFISGEGFASVNVVGTRTNAGTASNTLDEKTPYTFNSDTNASNYDVTVYDGTLTVNKRKVTVTSGSAVCTFGNLPTDGLTNKATCKVSGYGFVTGEMAEGYPQGNGCLKLDSEPAVGSPVKADNTIEYVWAGNGNPANYEITENYGKLIVTNNDEFIAYVPDYVCTYDGLGHDSEYATNLPGTVTATYTVDGKSTTDPASLMKNVKRDDQGIVTAYVVQLHLVGDGKTADASYSVTINPRELTLTAGSGEWVYDGKEHTCADYTIGGDGFANDTEKDDAKVSTTGTIKNVGTVKNGISCEKNGSFNPDNYTINSYKGDINPYEGDLTVTERQVILISKALGLTPKNVTTSSDDITTSSEEDAFMVNAYEYATLSDSPIGKVLYDGNEHSQDNVVEVGNPDHGGLKEIKNMGFVGDEGVTFSDFTKAEDAGFYRNEFTYTKKDNTELSNYNIKCIYGVIKISPREVTITSKSASKMYDGKALTANEVIVSGDDFVKNEGFTFLCTGSQTRVGTSYNTFEYELKDSVKEINYSITAVEGTLEVYDNNTLRLVSPGDQTYVYDGKAHGEAAKAYIGDTPVSAEEVFYSTNGGKTYINDAAVATSVGTYKVIAKVEKNGYEGVSVEYTITVTEKIATGDRNGTSLWIILMAAAVLALAGAAVMFFRRKKFY